MTETQPDSARAPSWEPAAGDVLSRIVETKRTEVSRLSGRESELRSRAADASEPRDFRGAVARGGVVSLIAEVKRRSPGAGAIRPDLDPAALAAEYAESGAAALSVLTDREYFGGSLQDLERARSAAGLPVLRKDFLISEVQVFEARSAGADAVLLIASILEEATLRELRELAEGLGMAALVEVHDEQELGLALDSGASLVGINNRNLRDFTTRLETTTRLVGSVPDSLALVSESGIRTRADVSALGEAGVDAILVGEALLRAPSPGEKARELVGVFAARRASATLRR